MLLDASVAAAAIKASLTFISRLISLDVAEMMYVFVHSFSVLNLW